MAKCIHIEGKTQNYHWGGFRFIPSLLSIENNSQPYAEYWLGAHPSAPSVIKSAPQITVDAFLAENNSEPLNFLFKILDVHEMLSIQSHPSKKQAEEGFRRENNLGIDLKAKNRNYKDPFDKPELMLALSEFWLLHGLKNQQSIINDLSDKPYLSPLADELERSGVRAGLMLALNEEDPKVIEMTKNLIADQYGNTSKNKWDPEFWVQRWLQSNPNISRGLLTLFFLNIVKLEKGQAIYQPPGLLHAYLEGQNVELMANSDNVFRAGLTPKHIDVNELLNTCKLASSQPHQFIIKAHKHSDLETVYPSPFKGFELSEISDKYNSDQNAMPLPINSPELLFCIDGVATIVDQQGENYRLNKGDALLVTPSQNITVNLNNATIFRARNSSPDISQGPRSITLNSPS